MRMCAFNEIVFRSANNCLLYAYYYYLPSIGGKEIFAPSKKQKKKPLAMSINTKNCFKRRKKEKNNEEFSCFVGSFFL